MYVMRFTERAAQKARISIVVLCAALAAMVTLSAIFGAKTVFAIAPLFPVQEQQAGFTSADTGSSLHAQSSIAADVPGSENSVENIRADPDKQLKKGAYDFAYDAYNSGHFKTAFENAMPRALAGDPQAQTLLGILYMDGRNVPLDPQKALQWYERAAKGGDSQAQLRYGIDIFNGLHGVKNQKLGEYYIRRATIAGVPQAYFYYGQIMMDNAAADARADIGLQWFLRGAAAGDPGAAFAASQILAEGTAKIPVNEPQARTLLEIAAYNNSVAAQIELSRWLVMGRGGAKDEKQAFDLMKIVAVDGVPPAQITLARYYNEGIGTKADIVKAAAWYMAAKRANYTSDDLEDMVMKLTPQQMKQANTAAARLLYEP